MEGIVFYFLKFMSFTTAKKPGLKDFPEKRVPHKVKYFQPICQILRNFTEGKERKVAVRFIFAFRAQLTS